MLRSLASYFYLSMVGSVSMDSFVFLFLGEVLLNDLVKQTCIVDEEYDSEGKYQSDSDPESPQRLVVGPVSNNCACINNLGFRQIFYSLYF